MAVHVDVYTELNRSSIDRSAADIQRELERRGEKAGQGYTAGFARAVERDGTVRAAADKVADKLDKVVAAEAKRATQLEKSKAINEAVAESEAKVNRLRSAGAESSAKAAEADLAKLREKQVEINNKLVVSATAVSTAERARAAAMREAGDAYRKMGDDVEGLGTKLANLGSVSGALKLNLGLAALGTLPAAATAITEVAGALQQLAGAGFAVPGIFAGIASSVAVGALGMYGIADAIKAIDKASDGTKAHVEAANAALAKLPASSADVAKTVVGLKGTFTDLSTIASTNMFDGFSAGLKGLAAADLPAITRGVDGISRGINQNLLQAMNSLGSSSSQGFLDRIFGNTASAQSKLTAAIDPIVHAVGTLSAAGSDTLPRLADAVGKVADRFDRFISAADGDGRLKKWIDEGLDGFTNLGNTALNIGKSFTAITEAAGGGAGLLGTLESATGKMSAFLNSTEGQTKLKEFFAEGRDMLGQLKDVATSAGPVLAGVFQSGITAANLWLPVIKQALDMLNGIPGGAALAVGAFTTWKTIAGVTSLITSLTKIKELLGVGIPNAATGVSSKLNSALALTGPLAAVTALSAAYDGILHKLDKITNTNIPSTVGEIPGSGAWIYDRVVGDKPWLPQQTATGSANPNQNVMPGPNGAASVVTAPSGTPYDPFAVAGIPRPGTRGVGGVARPDGPWNSTPSVGVSGYTAPAITKGSGSANGGVPFIDPSKYQGGDPLAGMPAAVAGADPTKVYDADSKLITAAHNLEQGKLALQVLEAKGNATQQELLTAKNNLVEQERALSDAQAKDIKARTNQAKKSTADMQEIGVKLDQDLGISKGLAGIADNLVRFVGSLALAPWEAKMQAITNAPGQAQGGFGLMGILGAQGAFGPQYTAAGQAAASGNGASALGPAALMPGGAYPGDAALLANVPAGSYSQTGNADLTKGLGDCSSAVEDLVNLMDGGPTGGRSMSTGNEAQWLTQHGFQPGMGGPGDFRVGFNGGHTQATLPGGTPFNWGSNAAAANRGIGGTGADDPAFTSHYYRPIGASSAPVSVGAPGAVTAGAMPASSALSGLPIPLPVTIVGGGGFGGGSPFGIPGAPGGGAPGAAPGTPASGQGFGPAPGPFGGGDPNVAAPTPGGGIGWGSPLPPMPAGAGGQGFGPGASSPGSIGQGVGPSAAPGTQIGAAVAPAGGTGKGGVGASDSTMALAGMAASALDVMAPGAGQAAQIGMKLANRAVQYGGQVAGIGVQGLMQTVLPTGGSELANNSWASKLIGGLAGAAPALPNMAGKPAAPPAQGQGQQGQQGGGGDTHNNINVTNQRPTEDGTGKDIAWNMQNMYQPAGKP